MKTLIAILTGLHVLAHGVFGCCDHGWAVTSPVAQTCACRHAAQHHHGHGHSSDLSRCISLDGNFGEHELIDNESPAPAPHDCFHAACHWVIGDVAPIVSPFDASAPAGFPALLSTDMLAMQAAEIWPDAAARAASAPPLRLHIALGVILV